MEKHEMGLIISELCIWGENVLQWIDPSKTGNYGASRFDSRMLREKIAEARQKMATK